MIIALCLHGNFEFLALVEKSAEHTHRWGSLTTGLRPCVRAVTPTEMLPLERQKLSINGVDLSYVKRGEGDHAFPELWELLLG